MLKSLIAVAWADGRVAQDEAHVVDTLLSAFEVTGQDAEMIREYAKTPRTLDDLHFAHLSENDRRTLLQHAVLISYVDGRQSDAEASILGRLVEKLGIPDGEASALLEAASTRAKSLLDRF